MLKKDAFLKVGGSEDEFTGSYEDSVLIVKLSLKYPFYGVDRCWYKYRIHKTSWKRREGKMEGLKERKRFLKWVKEYLEIEGISDVKVWDAFKKAKWQVENIKLFSLLNLYYSTIATIEGFILKRGRKILPEKARSILWKIWKKITFT